MHQGVPRRGMTGSQRCRTIRRSAHTKAVWECGSRIMTHRIVCRKGREMPRNRRTATCDAGWLSPSQQRAWVAYMRVQLRMTYEINRQLQLDNDLSLADYHVLNALSGAPDHRLQVTDLATLIGWERSRLSHHLRRMCERGLTERVQS